MRPKETPRYSAACIEDCQPAVALSPPLNSAQLRPTQRNSVQLSATPSNSAQLRVTPSSRRVQMVTIRDVARAAGVGVGTASRALNGSGPVSAAVRARVQTAAQARRFGPNRAAQTLITGRSLALAGILADRRN